MITPCHRDCRDRLTHENVIRISLLPAAWRERVLAKFVQRGSPVLCPPPFFIRPPWPPSALPFPFFVSVLALSSRCRSARSSFQHEVGQRLGWATVTRGIDRSTRRLTFMRGIVPDRGGRWRKISFVRARIIVRRRFAVPTAILTFTEPCDRVIVRDHWNPGDNWSLVDRLILGARSPTASMRRTEKRDLRERFLWFFWWYVAPRSTHRQWPLALLPSWSPLRRIAKRGCYSPGVSERVPDELLGVKTRLFAITRRTIVRRSLKSLVLSITTNRCESIVGPRGSSRLDSIVFTRLRRSGPGCAFTRARLLFVALVALPSGHVSRRRD